MIVASRFLSNIDVALLALPTVIPGAILSCIVKSEAVIAKNNYGCSKGVSAIGHLFRVVTLLSGLPLVIYSYAKFIFVSLLNRVLCSSLCCCIKLRQFEEDQHNRVFEYGLVVLTIGFKCSAIKDLVLHPKNE